MRQVLMSLSLLLAAAHAQAASAQEAMPSEQAAASAEADEAAIESDDVYQSGTFGLSFAVPTGGAPTAGVTYFLSQSEALRADFGFAVNRTEDPMTNESSTVWGFSIEVGYRMYRLAIGRVRPFLVPSLFLSKAAADGDFSTLMTVAVTGGFGVEYMFWDGFSIAGSTGLALSFANEFKNISLTTGTTALFASFYF